ncbi:CLUMA_CG004924, isoform C [Clunio marinus]|uniref:CLUMA_CG004924, isoform C n=1 Tax=Clunio marinus TaxID=568069 RepID=A0A1J1HUM6_9DIPT|nr:CLUMA_CG004924, isoform C [Clunio marinus]
MTLKFFVENLLKHRVIKSVVIAELLEKDWRLKALKRGNNKIKDKRVGFLSFSNDGDGSGNREN